MPSLEGAVAATRRRSPDRPTQEQQRHWQRSLRARTENGTTGRRGSRVRRVPNHPPPSPPTRPQGTEPRKTHSSDDDAQRAAAIAAAVLQRWRQRHSPPACPTPAPTHENGADGPGVLRLRPDYLLTALAAPSASSVRAELYCSAVALLPLSRIGRPAPQPSRRRWLLCVCVCAVMVAVMAT